MFHLDLIFRLGGRCPGKPPTVDIYKECGNGRNLPEKICNAVFNGRLRLFPALFLWCKEQLGHRPLQGARQPLQAVERGSTLAPFDEIEEIQGHGRFLRKLFLRQALRASDLAQPRAELLPKSAHLVSLRNRLPEEHQRRVCVPHLHIL